MVSVSPQRRLEIVLPTLPEFQGATVSCECFSQFFPPGIVVELRASPPLWGSLEQLLRPSPAGPPLQGTELAAPSTPEASLERLVPLEDYLAAWKLLPNVSCWVLQTVEKGYRIQFSTTSPPFKVIFLTLVSPEQALVLEQEVITLLRKEAIKVVPPLDRESGFYSRYFIVPTKDGRLRPILDLVWDGRWEVCYQGQSLPISVSFLRPSTLTPNIHKVCGCCSGSFATPGYLHTQLHQRLFDFSSIRADGGSTSRSRSRSYVRVGVKTKRQKKCAFSITEDHISGRGVGFDHDAGTFVSCSDRVDSHCSQESQRRPVIHCQAVSKIAGSDGSCVQCDTFWPAVHETPAVVAQDQGVLPEEKPASHDQGHAVMPTCLGHVEKTWFLSQGPVLVAPCRRITLETDASLTGWGAVMSGHPAHGLWSRSPSHVAHQLPGDAGHVSNPQTLSSGPKKSPQRCFFISITREVCVCTPYTSWRTRYLCGARTSSSR